MPLVDIEVEVRRETEKAVLVHNGVSECWLPKSQVEIGERQPQSNIATVTLPEWLANREGNGLMNAPARTFTSAPAVREKVPLLVGLMGPSGGGKTFSALRLATGIQRVSGGDIYVIDTEARRALHYADQFRFEHLEFNEPFGSLDYLAAIKHCVAKGAGVVVIDSMTHEHAGVGGYLMTQEAELDRMAGDDYGKRERMKFAAWIKPSKLRRQMIDGILQLNANFVFCFRAKEKTKPVPGKQPIEMGFMPLAAEEMLFEMTVNALLLPKAGGVPTWRSDNVGEKLMMKLPGQFASLFPEGKAIDEVTGEALALWARGDRDATAEAEKAAAAGTEAFRAHWKALSPALRESLRARLDAFQATATRADAARNPGQGTGPGPTDAGEAPDASPAAGGTLVDDLRATGDARAAAGPAALAEFLDGLTPAEGKLVAQFVDGWEATAGGQP